MALHSDVHVDRPLSNFAVQYRNKQLIGEMVAPFVPVNFKSDEYFVFTKKDSFTVPETIRGPKSTANEVTWSTSTSTYGCIDHALRDFLSDAIVANSDAPIRPRQRTTGFLTDLLLLAYERYVSSLVTTYANYGASYRTQLSGDDQWSASATSDPIGVVEDGKAACFVEPNVMIVGEEVWRELKHHPQIVDKIKGGATAGDPAIVRPELVADIFEVERLLIGKAKYNSSNKAQTASYSYVWGKDAVLAYIAPEVSLENVSAWKSFRWRQMDTDAGYKVRTYRDESLGGGGEYIEVEHSYDLVNVCSDVAYLIDTAVA